MKSSSLIVSALALVLLGAGCLPETPTTVTPPTSAPPTTVTPPEDLPPGTFKTVKGKTDSIRNVQLVPTGDRVLSPLIIAGEARLWYFEASFPVKLMDQNNRTLVETYASADGDWMTEDWVPFTSELIFTPPPAGTRGKLILMKDNPSGLPEHDDRVEIPVMF
jgi:hypothetical protein